MTPEEKHINAYATCMIALKDFSYEEAIEILDNLKSGLIASQKKHQ